MNIKILEFAIFQLKKLNIIFLILIILIFCSLNLSATGKYPQNYFRSPVSTPISIFGNFGEIRQNHFHSGLDIFIPYIGANLFSVADGYVSRIKVSPVGYGNAIYINHPNGYTSVYAHMDEFNYDISMYISEYQYKNQVFDVDLYPDSSMFILKKGEIIGTGGNSGRSFAPHLHFEIRETKTEIPINPLLFGYKISDEQKPEVYSISIIPQNESSFINKLNKNLTLKTAGKSGKFYLKKETPEVWGEIGFAVETEDFIDKSRKSKNIYSVGLYVDDTLIHYYNFEKFAFDQSRCSNSYSDYELYLNLRKKIRKSYTEPGNSSLIYKDSPGNGIYKFNKNKIYKIKFEICDINNNVSYVRFDVLGKITKSEQNFQKVNSEIMKYNQTNFFAHQDIRIIIPENCLYTDIKFLFSQYSSNYFSDIYRVHSINTPLNMPIIISISAEKIPENLVNKAIIAEIDLYGNLGSIGGKYINGFITAETKTFGNYVLTVDTIPPEVEEVVYTKKTMFLKEKQISFIINDKVSKIKNISGFIDQKWVLFKYDEKNNIITYKFDNHITYGQNHNVILIVTDKKDNTTIFNTSFFK